MQLYGRQTVLPSRNHDETAKAHATSESLQGTRSLRTRRSIDITKQLPSVLCSLQDVL